MGELAKLCDPVTALVLLLLVGFWIAERRDRRFSRMRTIRRDQYVPPDRVCPHRGRPGRRES